MKLDLKIILRKSKGVSYVRIIAHKVSMAGGSTKEDAIKCQILTICRIIWLHIYWFMNDLHYSYLENWSRRVKG